MTSNVGADGPKRVWILGAGFSRSLGGPLMGDLFSLAARRLILAMYNSAIRVEEADLIFWLFHFGNGFREGPLDPRIGMTGEDRWRDAEHFLEILDNACTDQAKADVVHDAFKAMKRHALPLAVPEYPGAFGRDLLPDLRDLSTIAKRIVAASCCVFMDGTTRENIKTKERWVPYLRWFARLRPNDTIVTFNYDRVVETLEVGGRNNPRRVDVVVPGPDADLENLPHDSPRLLKLHGSVAWKIVNDKIQEVESWHPSMLAADTQLAIATPGDNKMQMAKKAFDELWKMAETALREASEVFVVGFRFPPSDAFPRNRLLAALHENNNTGLRVHVVLGPEHNPERQRVLSLLQWTLSAKARVDEVYREESGHPEAQLTAYSLYAEDFLDSWARIDNSQRSISR